MNHKLTMHKLEELRREKYEESKEIHKKIAKISDAINEHKRLYLQENKYAIACGTVLAGYNKEEIRETLSFMYEALVTPRSEGYGSAYKGIDIAALIKRDDFFDFLITNIGRSVIVELKKRFGEVRVIDGGRQIESKRYRGNNENFRIRLWRKIAKKNVVNEAKRLLSEDAQ